MEVTIANMVERWSGLERPLFKGKLIDNDGCKCAQGDVLSCAGFSDDELRRMDQAKADKETARILGISTTHAVILRLVNDQDDGAPQIVLSNPAKILGDQAPLLLAFWCHLDRMSLAARSAVRSAERAAAWSAAELAAEAAAWAAARSDSWAAVRSAVRSAAWDDSWSAAWASHEIQGMDKLEAAGKQPYFLAFFGFDTWDKVRELVP
jgi:hypothetical protein